MSVAEMIAPLRFVEKSVDADELVLPPRDSEWLPLSPMSNALPLHLIDEANPNMHWGIVQQRRDALHPEVSKLVDDTLSKLQLNYTHSDVTPEIQQLEVDRMSAHIYLRLDSIFCGHLAARMEKSLPNFVLELRVAESGANRVAGNEGSEYLKTQYTVLGFAMGRLADAVERAAGTWPKEMMQEPLLDNCEALHGYHEWANHNHY